MKYLVLVSHGGLAEGVQSSLGMFAGDKLGKIRFLCWQILLGEALLLLPAMS